MPGQRPAGDEGGERDPKEAGQREPGRFPAGQADYGDHAAQCDRGDAGRLDAVAEEGVDDYEKQRGQAGIRDPLGAAHLVEEIALLLLFDPQNGSGSVGHDWPDPLHSLGATLSVEVLLQ